MRRLYIFTIPAFAILSVATAASAQTPAADPSARLKSVLPAPVADAVLAVIAKARSRDLPTQALADRALKFAAKGVQPALIQQSVTAQEQRMEQVSSVLRQARGTQPAGDEVEAGAEAMRKGVDGARVSALARSAPSGRSLAVPLYVIGSLIDRGLPSDSALIRVQQRLIARASDADLQRMPRELPSQAVAGRANRPTDVGRAMAGTKAPGSAAGATHGAGAAGPPAGVPANGGSHARPTTHPGHGHHP
jgi:hypothetical protein